MGTNLELLIYHLHVDLVPRIDNTFQINTEKENRMSKTIKMVIDDKTHARLVAKAEKQGMKRERLYQQIMEKASKER